MSMTKFQHLMCVGSYDPLPSTFGPPIKASKVKEPEVTIKDGFTRVDGKVVSYDPFQDPQHSLRTGQRGRIKHMPPNYLYAMPVTPSKNAPPISEVLGNKNNSEQGTGLVVVLDQRRQAAWDILPFPVEQPKVEEHDLKSCLAKYRVIASAVAADMQSVGWTGSYSEWQINQNLLDDLKTEIDSYLSPKTAQAPDNRSEETGIISALVHATQNGAVWDRQAIMKELAEGTNFSVLQEIRKQESARVAEHVSAYANIWISESAINDRRHVNWRDKCERGGRQITSVGRSEELFHSVHTDTAAYLTEAAVFPSLDQRAHWYVGDKLVHIGESFTPTTLDSIDFSRGPLTVTRNLKWIQNA